MKQLNELCGHRIQIQGEWCSRRGEFQIEFHEVIFVIVLEEVADKSVRVTLIVFK